MMQLTLLNFKKTMDSVVPSTKYPGGWVPPSIRPFPNVRFAPEVPHEECEKCPYATYAHPLVPIPGEPNAFNKLCTKDCLKAGVPLKRDKESGYFELLEVPC